MSRVVLALALLVGCTRGYFEDEFLKSAERLAYRDYTPFRDVPYASRVCPWAMYFRSDDHMFVVAVFVAPNSGTSIAPKSACLKAAAEKPDYYVCLPVNQ